MYFYPLPSFLELFRLFYALITCPDYVWGKYFLTWQNNTPLKQNGRHLVLLQGGEIYGLWGEKFIAYPKNIPPSLFNLVFRERERNS